MTAAALRSIAEVSPDVQSHYDAFDAARRTPSAPVLNDHALPGAADALRTWAASQGYEVTSRIEHGSRQLVVTLGNGSTTTVTNAREVTS